MFIPLPIPDDMRELPKGCADFAAAFGKECELTYGEFSADTPDGYMSHLVLVLHVKLGDLHCAEYVLESLVRADPNKLLMFIAEMCLALDNSK